MNLPPSFLTPDPPLNPSDPWFTADFECPSCGQRSLVSKGELTGECEFVCGPCYILYASPQEIDAAAFNVLSQMDGFELR
jgi:hypothetical protein